MNVTAVVLNWRRPDETIGCVRSLQATAPGVRIVVVDNASADGSVETMRAALNDVTFVENPENRGYAGGNNAGIALAASDEHCEAVLILNNDVVVRPGCVARLTQVLEQRDANIVAPVSLRRDDPRICDFWTAEVDVANLAVVAHGRDEPWRPPAEPTETAYATGSAMLVASHVFPHVAAFDERFFLVWEDVDFCLRVEAEYRGTRVLAVPDAEVLHGQSVTFGGAGSALYRYFYTRNAFLMLDKHLGRLRRRKTRAMIENRFRGGIERESDPVVRAALERGLADGLAGRFGPPPRDLVP